MRRAGTPAIPPKMYRHFAIVTLALTTGLAMFADGENREAQAHIATPQPVAAPAPATFVAPSSAATYSAPSDWYDDAGAGEFGQPMERLLGAGSSSVIPDLSAIAAPGYTPEYLATLSEKERELLLQGLRDNGMLAPDVHSRRRAALEAASARRAGAATSAD